MSRVKTVTELVRIELQRVEMKRIQPQFKTAIGDLL